MTSAGLADIAEREAKAVAALDRALEARLGELDRAFATRRTEVGGRLAESESALSEAIEAGVSQFKRAASDERRLLQEEAAALLHNFERASRDHLRRLTDATSEALASLDGIVRRVHELEHATATLQRLGEAESVETLRTANAEAQQRPGRSEI